MLPPESEFSEHHPGLLPDDHWNKSAPFYDMGNYTRAVFEAGSPDVLLDFDDGFRRRAVMHYLERDLLGPQRAAVEVLVPMCLFYVLIFITGVVGNTVTIWVISRNPRMHTGGTNYYLINLAISDLLSLILGLPFEVYQLFEEYPYPFAEQFCRARAWVSEASTLSSVFTILAFTVERYIAICHPFKNIHFRTKSSRVILTIIVSWVLAFTAAGPMGMEFGIMRFPYPVDTTWVGDLGGVEIPESAVCTARAEGPMAVLIQFSTFAFFFLPMFVIIFLHIIIGVHLRRSSDMTRDSVGSNHLHGPQLHHHRHNHHHHQHRQQQQCNGNGNGPTAAPQQTQLSHGRQSVLRMLVAVALAFFVCYAPHHAQRMHAVYEKTWDHKNMFIHRILTYISGVFYYGASTVNPFLYSILSARFRKAYRSTLCYCLFKRTDLQRSGLEQYSFHSANSQALAWSLRYRPSTSNDELAYFGTRQNSLMDKSNTNGHGSLSLRSTSTLNGHNHHTIPMKTILWSAPKKFLAPTGNRMNGVRDALVIYDPKKKKQSNGRKKPKVKSPKVTKKNGLDADECSSISGSSLQEKDIDPEQVSDFINGTHYRGSSTTPRLIIHPPSCSSGSANSRSDRDS
ncbi:putative Neuropeptides capa receptor [Hypsibius exemplaris]|uniref:Neuropeptides capa receptor n=1 Tax=Hypsibius exemplaris TaxID=2072580 RepID=A0A9X6NI65_HYPEX|nr:putative Neuropeptides capa receptor [Hypsibius exemplaris]